MTKSIITLLLASAMVLAAAESKKKPNILFVFADDMSLDTIGALGKYNCKTPHLDKLMASGASFTHSYNMGA